MINERFFSCVESAVLIFEQAIDLMMLHYLFHWLASNVCMRVLFRHFVQSRDWWEVDLMGVYFVRVDLMGGHPKKSTQ